MQFVNCTPHGVRIYDMAGEQVLWTFRASGNVVRISTAPQEDAGKLETCHLHAAEATCSGDLVPNGAEQRAYSGQPKGPGEYAIIPLVTAPDLAAGTVSGIPEWMERFGYHDEAGYPYALIVGQIGAEAVARVFPGPVFATDTGPASVVRDLKGNILGVRRLILVSRGRGQHQG